MPEGSRKPQAHQEGCRNDGDSPHISRLVALGFRRLSLRLRDQPVALSSDSFDIPGVLGVVAQHPPKLPDSLLHRAGLPHAAPDLL
jgi:hypothetical protein